MHKEALRTWVRQAEAEAGWRLEQLTSVEREELKRLRMENNELKRANEILKAASAFFAAEPDRLSGIRVNVQSQVQVNVQS